MTGPQPHYQLGRSPPRFLNVLAAGNSTCIDGVSAKLNSDTSNVSCTVPPGQLAVTSSLSSATVVMSASPHRVISGPDSPADTQARSVLTVSSYQACARRNQVSGRNAPTATRNRDPMLQESPVAGEVLPG
jgi:hypothetical protein